MSLLRSNLAKLIALPYELKHQLLMECAYKETESLCSTHSSFNAICSQPSFWVEKVRVHRPNFISNPEFHTVAILKQLFQTLTENIGSVYMSGKLVDHTTTIPERIGNNNNIISVCCTTHGAVYVTKPGNVYVFGSNNEFELGLGPDKSEILQPVKNHLLHNIVKVSSISGGVMYLDDQGKVYITGAILRHAIPRQVADYPMPIPSLRNIVDIASGYSHYLCLSVDGSVYIYREELEQPTKIPGLNNIVQINSNGYGIICLDVSGKIYLSTIYDDVSIKQINFPDITQVACGSSKQLYLDRSGNVYLSGTATKGQYGDANPYDNSSPIIVDADNPVKILVGMSKIFCGNSSIICITNDGYLLETGNNMAGQLGLGDYNYIPKFVPNDYISHVVFVSFGFRQTAFIVADT